MCRIARRLLLDIRGATAVEYGLIAALVSLTLIAALIALGGSLDSLFLLLVDVLDQALGAGATGST